jgi:hypothetical protein
MIALIQVYFDLKKIPIASPLAHARNKEAEHHKCETSLDFLNHMAVVQLMMFFGAFHTV